MLTIALISMQSFDSSILMANPRRTEEHSINNEIDVGNKRWSNISTRW